MFVKYLFQIFKTVESNSARVLISCKPIIVSTQTLTDLRVSHIRNPLFSITYLTKTHNWVEWTAASVSFSQTKVNDINLNYCPQMQNDTENEIGRSLFPFIEGVSFCRF